jgi:hypothetical protein
MSLVRISSVTPLAGQRLRLGLTDGTTIERDVGPLKKVTALAQALEHSETRTEASKALRGLIDAIVPDAEPGRTPNRTERESGGDAGCCP